MTKKLFLATALSVASFLSIHAGGMLTNTNQNVAFLRNPARDGAIGIDGVYSNPAGVAFMNDGLHLSLNWQSAWQTRTIKSTNPVFALGVQNNGQKTKTFEGDAQAPFVPSVQLAYNMKSKWSLQFGFAVVGGGGKCEFENGLGSFESAVGNIASQLQGLGATGYDMNSYLQGKQYYFGFTVGAAYKVCDYVSVYAGVRMLYGMATYKAKIDNIKVNTANGLVSFGDFLNAGNAYLTTNLNTVNAGIAQCEQAIAAYGNKTPATVLAQYEQLKTTKATIETSQGQLEQLQVYRDGVNLQCDQSDFGIAPILGVDIKAGNFNFAVKYEFRTKMSMLNESTVKQAMAVEQVNKFQDGKCVREDSPALLTFGAQYSVLKNVRLNAGYHLFYDKEAKKYNDEQKKLGGRTNEYLGGVEVDATKKLTLSGGFQITRYGNTDEFINDMSFVVDSWSYGFGLKYQVTDKVAVNAAYFKTCYDDYTTTNKISQGITDTFTRSNRVAAIGVDIDF